MSLLSLEDVEVSYGAVRALHGVSISVESGTMVALLGANGAGKSTTLRAISGMVRPTRGLISFDGQRLIGSSPNQVVRMGIAHVPEGRKIFKDLTVLENLRMGAYSRRDTRGVAKDLDGVFELFPRLRERYKQLGGTLSGGEQQMLAIGRGLMARPRLLLLDEPSLGLAPLVVRDIFAALRLVNEEHKTAMLVVEQNANVALKNTAYGFVLQVGRVSLQGTSLELRQNEQVVDSYMGTSARAARA